MFPHMHDDNALRQITMHISANDLHCCTPALLLQLVPSGGRPRSSQSAIAPPHSVPPHQEQQTTMEDLWTATSKSHQNFKELCVVVTHPLSGSQGSLRFRSILPSRGESRKSQ
jgi:hypothetical protein